MSIRKRTYKTGTKYQVQYRDPLGQQRSKQFDTKREATAFEADMTTTMRKGEWADPTLKEVCFSVGQTTGSSPTQANARPAVLATKSSGNYICCQR